MRRIVFLLFPGFEMLDFVGPLQVLHEAKKRGLELELLFTGNVPSVASEQGLTLKDLEPYPEFRADDHVFIPGFTLELTPIRPELVKSIHRAY